MPVGEALNHGISAMMVWDWASPKQFAWLPRWLRRPLVLRLMNLLWVPPWQPPRPDGMTIERYLAGEPMVSFDLRAGQEMVGHRLQYGDVIRVRVVRERGDAGLD